MRLAWSRLSLNISLRLPIAPQINTLKPMKPMKPMKPHSASIPSRRGPYRSLFAAGLLGLLPASAALAEDADPIVAPDDAILPEFDSLPPIVVIGSQDAVYDLPGSGYYVDTEEIREYNFLNVNRMLTRIPGVYVREEDGFGNFPNISIRGGDGTRSENVSIMEDGILTAPAPYSAPAAYYSPNAARMSGIEVLKGSSQVLYGPHTTGGVINYLSTPIPETQTMFLRGSIGTDATSLGHAYYGDVIDTDAGRFGFLLEMFYKGSNGFRTIDAGNGFGGSDDTGFTMYEPMFKAFWEPNTALQQRFEVKYGYTQFDANETYVGLSESDLGRSPYRRYAGTFLDNMFTEQHRSYIKWQAQPSDALSLNAAAYYNNFSRNWYKIRKTDGESIHKVLANPGGFANAFDVLRMRTPGTLGIRANNRDYYAYGVQVGATYDFLTGPLEHSVDFGARYHYDQIRRFQRDDKIVVGAPGVRPRVDRGIEGSGGNRFQEADAFSVWIQDTIGIGRLTLSPGVRYEYLDLAFTEFASDPTNTVTGSGSGTTDIFAPGIGATLDLTDATALFGGVFKGISAPGPRNNIKNGVDWEESIGYELGLRHRRGAFYGEIAGFFTDYSNITGSDAGLGGSDASNAGEAEVKGAEILVSYDPFHDRVVRMPLFLSGTYTDATLGTALSEGGGDDIFAGGVAGAAIPYVPDLQMAAGVGLETDRWGIELSTTYVSDTFGTARNLDSPLDSSRQGKIDGGFIADLAGYYQLNDRLKLTGGVHNLLDQVLTTSRIPEGPRSNAPRMFYVGFEMLWEPRSVLPLPASTK